MSGVECRYDASTESTYYENGNNTQTSEAFTVGASTIATGTSPVSGTLGQLDPTLLANGSYLLRLEATNAANWVKTRHVQKLGRRRSGRGGGRNSGKKRGRGYFFT